VALDANRPPFNPGLVRALHELAISDTPQARFAVYDALLRSELLLPVWNEFPKDRADLARPLWIGGGDRQFLPAFTDWRAISQWQLRNRPRSFLVVRGQGVFVAALPIKRSAVLINPDGPIGVPIHYPEIEILASGAIPGPNFERNAREMIVPQEAYVCLGAPVEAPASELVAGLSSALRGFPDVERAYLFQGSFGRGSQLTLGIAFKTRLTKKQLANVMRNLAPMIEGLGADQSMDALVLESELLGSVERQVTPFFQRDN
jgi:SseB protein N-terminal domain